MFLLNRISFLIFLIIVSLIEFSYAETNEEFIYYDSIEQVNKTLNKFNDAKFSVYLQEVSHHKFDDYTSAIAILFFDYRNYFNKMNGCVEISLGLEKNYNGDWINGLFSIAGRDYVIKHIESIQNLIHNIHNKHYKNFCIESEKELNYSEIQYLSVVKEFFNIYLSYIETLSKSKQKELISNKELAEKIIHSCVEPPFQVMRYSGRLGTYMNITYNVNLTPEVIEYILNHPTFLKPFNFVQAIQDLRKFTSNNH